MTKSRIFLHIGAPKTGTTYLQSRLANNARTLAQHGIHVPALSAVVPPDLSHFRAALDLLGQDWGGPPGHADGAWDSLARRARRHDGTVVISHEILAPAKSPAVARAHESLRRRDTELHIVYTARDMGRQIPAAWQESIKQGRSWPYAKFLRRATRRNPWFARAFNLPEVLSTWGAGLPPEHIHLVTIPHHQGDQLWERFAGVVGIRSGWAPYEGEQLNPSLGAAETQLLRRLNKRLDRTTREEREYDELLRALLADGSLFAGGSAPLTLPPDLHGWASAQSERWIDWIEQSGIDVVGEVDELRPAPPVAPDDYVDPDRIRPKQMLGPALDALALMTREAGSRPDPDQTVGRKVRRHVRARLGSRSE